MANSFIAELGYDSFHRKEENLYEMMFKEYERVVIQSLITSFGLDFIVNDQYGGDVDTIHNVRLIGKDKQMTYKNKVNEKTYEGRGEYDVASYHKSGNFRKMKHEAREQWQATGIDIKDEYTSGKIGFYGHTNSISPTRKAELDHIIAAKEIHDDRGRVLSGLKGEDLADSKDNLAWTNKSLNASMKDYNKEEYIGNHPELDEETKIRTLRKNQEARNSYNAKISTTYYTSSNFLKNTTKAAVRVGVTMGLRQVLGLVFSEIWFSVKDAIRDGKTTSKNLFICIGEGIEKGYEKAKMKYKELWSKFIEGSIAGVLASLTTTLCNIFFATGKNLIRILRQSWASLVEAVKILLINPDFLPFGERFRAAVKIIATGASVVAGVLVGEAIAKTGIGAIPVVGEIVQTFCATMVTGILSCSLLFLLDRNSTINKIVNALNNIPTVDDVVMYYRMQAELLEEYCAKLMNIDLEIFKKEIIQYHEVTSKLETVKDQKELNSALLTIYNILELSSPHEGYSDFKSFMRDSESKLHFR